MAGIAVKGLADVQRALRVADRDVRLGINKELREVARPVAVEAERLAVSEISRIGVEWSRMRVGQRTGLVYVAPKKRGVRSRSRKRPNLKPLLLYRAMVPALEHQTPQITRDFDQMLHRVAAKFNR